MPLPIVRYPLDPTGLNPDNRVHGEVHHLNAREIRAVAPTFGPFFTESLVIYDDTTNVLLVRGQDYQVVELLQEATVKIGKEICSLILILNASVSSVVRLNYQVLGGLYQNDASNVINMYETYLLDDRAVDWLNVLNKPLQYPPSLHNHLLEDVYGFEPIVIALERVRNAIVLSNIPSFEALITWVHQQIVVVDESTIEAGGASDHLVSWNRLLYALDKLNFNGITINPTTALLQEGDQITFSISSTNLPDSTPLYWTVEHIATQVTDFNGVSGIVNMVGNRGSFNLSIRHNTQLEADEAFKIALRKNGIDGYILAMTSAFSIGAHSGVSYEELMLNCCTYNPDIPIDPVSLYYLDSY